VRWSTVAGRSVSGQFCFSSTINTGGLSVSVNSNIYVLLQQGCHRDQQTSSSHTHTHTRRHEDVVLTRAGWPGYRGTGVRGLRRSSLCVVVHCAVRALLLQHSMACISVSPQTILCCYDTAGNQGRASPRLPPSRHPLTTTPHLPLPVRAADRLVT